MSVLRGGRVFEKVGVNISTVYGRLGERAQKAMAALFQLFDAMQVIALGLLRGVQDTRAPMWLAVISYWGVGVPVSYTMGFRLGFGGAGLWLGLAIGLAIAAALLMVRFWRGPWWRRIARQGDLQEA